MIVPLLVGGLTLILAYVGSQKHVSRPQFLFVTLFLGAGAVLVLFPGLATRAAVAVGVGRGTDLLLYFAVLSGVLIVAKFYFRIRENERKMVEISRRLAFIEPRVPLEIPLDIDATPNELLPNAWVVIPAHNEASVLGNVVSGARRVISRVVVVDDGSSDRTSDEAAAAGAVVLRHVVNLGQGAAIETGIRYAVSQGAEYTFTFDADGQHSPDSLVDLAAAMRRSAADVVLGSRTIGHVEGMPAGKRLLLRAASAFTRIHSRLAVTDTHNGLRLFTRDAALKIRISQPRMAHASEILEQIRDLHLRFVESPVTVRYTDYSMRKGQPLSAAFGILLDLLYDSITK